MLNAQLNCERVLFTKTAGVVLGIAAVLSAVVAPMPYVDLRYDALSRPQQVLLASIGAIGALAVVVLLVGMWLYWLKCDRSGKNTRIMWFVALLIGLPYGAIPYYICVYLPSLRRRLRGAGGRIPR